MLWRELMSINLRHKIILTLSHYDNEYVSLNTEKVYVISLVRTLHQFVAVVTEAFSFFNHLGDECDAIFSQFRDKSK